MACKANCNCYLTNLVGVDSKCNLFDMTDIYRVTITDDMSDKEKALFQSYNDNCEEVEDLWIELDFQMWEQMERAAKKLKNRTKKQRNNDDRDQVQQLHKQGFSLAEIASITKLDHETIYNWVHKPHRVRHTGYAKNRSGASYGLDASVQREVYGTFEGIPEEIRADLEEADFDLE